MVRTVKGKEKKWGFQRKTNKGRKKKNRLNMPLNAPKGTGAKHVYNSAAKEGGRGLRESLWAEEA